MTRCGPTWISQLVKYSWLIFVDGKAVIWYNICIKGDEAHGSKRVTARPP